MLPHYQKQVAVLVCTVDLHSCVQVLESKFIRIDNMTFEDSWGVKTVMTVLLALRHRHAHIEVQHMCIVFV